MFIKKYEKFQPIYSSKHNRNSMSSAIGWFEKQRKFIATCSYSSCNCYAYSFYLANESSYFFCPQYTVNWYSITGAAVKSSGFTVLQRVRGYGTSFASGKYPHDYWKYSSSTWTWFFLFS